MCNCSNPEDNCAFCQLPPAVIDAFVSLLNRRYGEATWVGIRDWLIIRVPDEDDDEVIISQVVYRIRTPRNDERTDAKS